MLPRSCLPKKPLTPHRDAQRVIILTVVEYESTNYEERAKNKIST